VRARGEGKKQEVMPVEQFRDRLIEQVKSRALTGES
jgi:hypothetical protein